MTSARHKFPNDPAAAKAARQFALENLPGYEPAVLQVVELLVSELATNCVRHTDSGFEVRVATDSRRIRIAITDNGSGRPMVQPLDPSATSGRGLALVKMFASSSGVRRSRSAAGGKTVWFVIDAAAKPSEPGSKARSAGHGSRGSDDRQIVSRPRRASDPPPKRLSQVSLAHRRRD